MWRTIYSHLIATRDEIGCPYELFERYCEFSIYRQLELGSLPWPNEYIDASDACLPVENVVFVADVIVRGKHIASAMLEPGGGRTGMRYRGQNLLQDVSLPMDGERSSSESGSDDEEAMPMSVFGRGAMAPGGGPSAGDGALCLSDVSYTLYAAKREEGGEGKLALVDRMEGQNFVVVRNIAQR